MNRVFQKTTGIVCTVLGGMISLWVVARLSSVAGWQQTWAPPLAPYEWKTLIGAAVAAGLLIVGLLSWTHPTVESMGRRDRANVGEF